MLFIGIALKMYDLDKFEGSKVKSQESTSSMTLIFMVK